MFVLVIKIILNIIKVEKVNEKGTVEDDAIKNTVEEATEEDYNKDVVGTKDVQDIDNQTD